MKVKILEVYEEKGQLRVVVECPYGQHNLGLNLKDKYLNPRTGEPRWKHKVHKHMKQLYGEQLEDKTSSQKRCDCFEDEWDKEYELEELEDPRKKEKRLKMQK